MKSLKDAPIYERIYAVARQIPAGQVATYGQIAAIVGSCTARMVGYAMAAVRPAQMYPGSGLSTGRAKSACGPAVLAARCSANFWKPRECILILKPKSVDFNQVGWAGPDWEWLEQNGFQPTPVWGRMKDEE